MNENTGSVNIPEDNNNAQDICNRVYEVANVVQVPSAEDSVYRFSSKTVSTGADTLVTLKVSNGKAQITVNCERMVIGSMLVKDLKTTLSKV